MRDLIGGLAAGLSGDLGMMTKIALALLCAGIALPSQAPAAELLFQLDTSGGALSFVLDETPTLGLHTDDYFGFWNLEATLDGAPIILELIQFWAGSPSRGGFDARTPAYVFYAAEGPQLYSGPTSSPTFLKGDFSTSGGALSISPVGAAVPEPASWALMIIGFGAAGLGLRRRRALAA